MTLDRARQRRILEALAGIYPVRASLASLVEAAGGDADGTRRDLVYLAQHGLVDCTLVEFQDGAYSVGAPSITHRGLDFLEDDGGLSAILGTVTVRLHQETLRTMLEDRVMSSHAPEPEKRRLREAIRAAPAKALEQVASRAVAEGLDRLPDAAQWLRSTLGL